MLILILFINSENKIYDSGRIIGHKTVNGLEMNFMQAVEAFKIVNNLKNKDKIKGRGMENKFCKDITEEDHKSKFPFHR